LQATQYVKRVGFARTSYANLTVGEYFAGAFYIMGLIKNTQPNKMNFKINFIKLRGYDKNGNSQYFVQTEELASTLKEARELAERHGGVTSFEKNLPSGYIFKEDPNLLFEKHLESLPLSTDDILTTCKLMQKFEAQWDKLPDTSMVDIINDKCVEVNKKIEKREWDWKNE
jgi:hypothetical protein